MSLTTFETREIRFPVEGYAVTKELAAHGEHYESDKFLVGGYDWAVRYYPSNGASHERQGNPSDVFSEHGEEKGFWTFVTHDALVESDYIVDDCFTLVCTVSVLKKPQPGRV
ncbi:hypothetical protein QOZ80_1BG0065260 [Eleusine coracana subsp. coracana]|nr:hypothetical protein QOZ80_1BG0065260 [Eleusine coracana subsp. coracana]